MKILAIEHSLVYRKFGEDLRKSRVAITKKNTTNTKYIAAFIEDNPVGVAGYYNVTDTHVRFKTAYVNPAFRGIKVYSNLWIKRLFIILKDIRVKVISAYCTEYSLPKFIKEGFIVQSKNAKGITYVKLNLNYETIQKMVSGLQA